MQESQEEGRLVYDILGYGSASYVSMLYKALR